MAVVERLAQRDPRRWDVAVDKEPTAGPHLAESVCRREVSVCDGVGCRPSALAAAGGRGLPYLFVAEEPCDVFECLRVRDSREDYLGAVVRDDRGRSVSSVDGADLGHVLEDGDELDSLPGAGRGEGRELAQRGDVRAFVENDQQRRVDRLSACGRELVRAGDDLLDEGCEERLQSPLLVRGRTEVGGVVAAVEEAFCLELRSE